MAGTYYPVARTISAVTNAKQPTVTFSDNHGYVVGQLLSFRVGTAFGMFQLDRKQAKVITVPDATSITIDVETTTWGTFAIPESTSQADCMALPIGSGFIDSNGIVQPNIDATFDKRPP